MLKQLLLCHRLAGNSYTILVISDSRVPVRVSIDVFRLLALKPLFSALLLEGFLEVWKIQRWCRKFGAGIAIAGHRGRVLRISYCGRIGLNDCLFACFQKSEDGSDKSGRPFLDRSVGFGPVPIFRDRRKRTVTQVRMQNIQVQHCYLPVSAHHFVSGISITDPAHALLPRYTYQRGVGEREQLQFHSMHQEMEFRCPRKMIGNWTLRTRDLVAFPIQLHPCVV